MRPGSTPFAVIYTRESPCRCGIHLLGAVRALGFPALGVPVEEIGRHRRTIARAPLVFEHIDRVRGSAEARVEVRERISSWGARLVGSPPRAARLADDKAAARRRLLGAGLPMAAGRLIAASGDLPGELDGLSYPLVLKSPLEHGSRGVVLVRSAEEVRRAAEDLIARGIREGERLLLEEHVGGIEVAATIVEAGGRPRCLPLVEVVLGRSQIYAAKRKWGGRSLPIRAARLPGPLQARVRRTALRAFRALGLRDYARIDLRVDRDGTPRVLEANVRPSVEPETEMPLAARLAGLDLPELVELMIASACRRRRLAFPRTEAGK